MKRILHIIPSLDRSGAEKQLVLLAEHLPRDEFEVRVCALTRGGPLGDRLAEAGVPWTVIGKRFKVDPAAWWRLYRHVKEVQPDIVQTWLFAANAYGRSAAFRAGVPVIVGGERSVDPWKRAHEFWIDRRLARHTARIVVNGRGVRDFYVQRGLPADKFVVIPNAVEPDTSPVRPREAWLTELGLPPNARLIASVGRLWPQKRMQDVIWAADLLKIIHDDVHLLIVGDGPERESLERFARQSQVTDRVHFLGHRPDVPALLPHIELLWLASEYEGLPNVVLEAMAAGIPVVVTDIPGCRELVVPGETGILVPVGDRAGLARGANTLLEDAQIRKRLGAAGRERALREFTVRRMVDSYTALYRELLEEAARAAAHKAGSKG